MIIDSLTDSQLLLEVLERVEAVRCVKLHVVFAVATLDLAVVSGGVRSNQLVPDAKPCQLGLEGGRRMIALGQ